MTRYFVSETLCIAPYYYYWDLILNTPWVCSHLVFSYGGFGVSSGGPVGPWGVHLLYNLRLPHVYIYCSLSLNDTVSKATEYSRIVYERDSYLLVFLCLVIHCIIIWDYGLLSMHTVVYSFEYVCIDIISKLSYSL